MSANPPIPGHGLISEGHTGPIYGRPDGRVIGHTGGCRCGARPPEFPNLSVNAMKRWHRDHKAELRGQAPVPIVERFAPPYASVAEAAATAVADVMLHYGDPSGRYILDVRYAEGEPSRVQVWHA